MPGVNVPIEIGTFGEKDHPSGWDSVANLATSPDGKLIIIVDHMHIRTHHEHLFLCIVNTDSYRT
ncbi:MAG: hypothetical protein HOE45_01755 [Gammaproteobacteria bacterium]|nr:hypothetical protein [Gammaproteobacteria bacterium]